jgi:hypothetical protein
VDSVNISPIRALLVVAFSFVMVTFSGCADDGDSPSLDETTVITPQNSPVPRDPIPTVEGRTVTNVAKGYRAVYPEGWEPRYDLAVSASQKLDAYFGPPRADQTQFRASISIACEQISTNEDSRAYYERKRAVTESTAQGAIIGPEQLSLGGVVAFRIEYSLDAGDQAVRKIDVFAATGTCGYTISLASSPEELAQHLTAWQEFLSSLSFL